MTLSILTSAAEAAQYRKMNLPPDSVVILASGIDTFEYLKKHQIKFTRLSRYYDHSSQTLWRLRRQAFKISKNFFEQSAIAKISHPVVDLPKFNYEYFRWLIFNLLQSLETARKIIGQVRPRHLIIGQNLSEDLLRITHTARFRLLNQALIALAANREITFLSRRRRNKSQTWQVIRLVAEGIINSVKAVIARRPAAGGPTRQSRNSLILSASHHQLTNLSPLIKKLVRRFQVLTIGKLHPRALKTIPQNWNFQNVNLISSLLPVKDHLGNILFSLTAWLKFLFLPKSMTRRYFYKTLGYDFWSLIFPTLSYFYSTVIFELDRNYRYINTLLKSIQPAFILSSNTVDYLNAALLSIARFKRLPYGLIIHDAQSSTFFDYNFLPDDTFLVWGKYQAKIISSDLPRSKCFITGNPEFDVYRPPAKVKNNLLPAGKLKILILTAENPFIQAPNQEILFDVINELLQKVGPEKITVKTHVADDCSQLDAYFANYSRAVSFSSAGTDKLILSHDIILTQSTSAGLHSILLGKPTIYLCIGSLKDYAPYALETAAIGVYSISNLILAINRLVKSPSLLSAGQNRFLKKFCGPLDGKSSDRLINFINRAGDFSA